ncbi:conserved putative membrane protein [Candidatus Protochlamydia naegleriophila]|uniref:Conserved putative membrane protein n=1 Tax=Candidatus Protochlamydia naegleriophila TaxID=389348 RepID=A0A0U5JEH9_9BACT|nr:hypothetical protein [Candidatus Protochlamydia naegleriophila]CUI16994.1 conserved putative membrane protein [Candidatus Protochlamydia naegleriophila]
MTHSHSKPDSSDSQHEGNPDQEEITYKRPEFIVIDDRPTNPYGYKKQTRYNSSGEQAGNEDHSQVQQGPFSLRFLCLLGVIFCFIFGIGLFFIASLSTVAAVVFLLQNGELNRGVRALWKLFSNVIVVGAGCMIGLISPTIGIGLMAVYFSLSGRLSSSDGLKRAVKRWFNIP